MKNLTYLIPFIFILFSSCQKDELDDVSASVSSTTEDFITVTWVDFTLVGGRFSAAYMDSNGEPREETIYQHEPVSIQIKANQKVAFNFDFRNNIIRRVWGQVITEMDVIHIESIYIEASGLSSDNNIYVRKIYRDGTIEVKSFSTNRTEDTKYKQPNSDFSDIPLNDFGKTLEELPIPLNPGCPLVELWSEPFSGDINPYDLVGLCRSQEGEPSIWYDWYDERPSGRVHCKTIVCDDE